MVILRTKISLEELFSLENVTFFDDMMKAVVDVKRGLVAVNAELHADLESFLLSDGSQQKDLYGINILDDGEIEYDSLINIPRNRDAGYPRGGRTVADPMIRMSINEIISQWITR